MAIQNAWESWTTSLGRLRQEEAAFDRVPATAA